LVAEVGGIGNQTSRPRAASGSQPPMFRFGSKADIALGPRHVRFVPKADIASADGEKKIGLFSKTRIFRAGYRELKCGTPRHVPIRPQATAMCLNDRTADR